MKFLVDVGVSNKVEKYLKDAGFDTKCIRELNPFLKDIEIIEIAAKDKRVVITMDKDFGELIYRQGLVHLGVILVRLAGLSPPTKARFVSTVIIERAAEMPSAFSVISPGLVRIRSKQKLVI